MERKPIGSEEIPSRISDPSTLMQTPEDVAVMLALHAKGWGKKRIARELGISPNTVRRYVDQGGWQPYSATQREGRLDELQDWLLQQFRQHRGNAAVVHQELQRVHGVTVSLRTVQRALEDHRQQLDAEAKATVRFETPPGRQLQIDFGETWVVIAGERVRVFLFVATLGFSRRIFVQAWPCQRQAQWFGGLEGCFAHFGGLPEQVLVDNPRPLVTRHDSRTRQVEWNEAFAAFCAHWGIKPRACAPYRARTKGKDERAVGYVKRNAIAGHTFESWAALEAHLVGWMREVADVRVHGMRDRLRPTSG